MKRFWSLWCAALMMFVLSVGMTSAQDDEIVEVVMNDVTYQVTLPPGWRVDESSTEGELILFSADSNILISVASLSRLMGADNEALLRDEDFRTTFFDEAAGAEIEGLDFEFRDDRVAGFRFFEEDDSSGLLLLLELEPDSYAMLTGFHAENEAEELFDAMNKIVSTVQPVGEAAEAATEEPSTASGGMRGGTLGGGSSNSNSSDTVDSCEVEADDGIALRVGPGANRATFGYLQTAGTFTAVAQSEADGVWYQLDKSEAAPNAPAAEIWVSADDVDAEAACEDLEVVEASAPVVRPSSGGGGSSGGNTGNSGGNSGGGNTNTGGGNNPPVAGSGNPVPASGTWTLSLSSTTNASCEGTENVAFPTTDLFSQLSFTGGLSASRDGSTLIIDGDAFVLQGETTYVGSFSIPEGNMQMYLVIQSSSLITGQAVYNFVIDGRPCSATIGLSVTRG